MESPQYKNYLNRLFAHARPGQNFGNPPKYSQEDLGSFTPEEIVSFLNSIAYGVDEPQRGAKPIARSSSVLQAKKAISYYMPNKQEKWDHLSRRGNPTQSLPVNTLIKTVKKMEVKGLGKATSARKAVTEEEFKTVLHIVKGHQGLRERYGVTALFLFQLHMIARIDDSCNAIKENLQENPNYPELLQMRLNWSKNVMTETDCPWQVLLPSININYCVYTALALWLEELHLFDPVLAKETPFLFPLSQDLNKSCEGKLGGGDKSKHWCQRFIRVAVTPKMDGDLRSQYGSHSNRKFAATAARKRGILKDELDARGRWKRSRISDTYVDDSQLSSVDMKVAAALTMDGPAVFKIAEPYKEYLSKELFEELMPGVTRNFGSKVAVALGKPLIHAAFELSEEDSIVLKKIRSRLAETSIKSSPILRIPATASSLGLTPLPEDSSMERQNDSLAVQSALYKLSESISTLASKQEAMNNSLSRKMANVQRGFDRMKAGEQFIRSETTRSSNQPMLVGTKGGSLHSIWEEYMSGVGGNRPVRLWSASDRGGKTVGAAIDDIYSHYGSNTSLTNILTRIKKDSKSGNLPPSLRI